MKWEQKHSWCRHTSQQNRLLRPRDAFLNGLKINLLQATFASSRNKRNEERTDLGLPVWFGERGDECEVTSEHRGQEGAVGCLGSERRGKEGSWYGTTQPVVSPGEELMGKVQDPCRFPAADTGRILYQISDDFISDCFKTLITT